jgi:hypothetical protein
MICARCNTPEKRNALKVASNKLPYWSLGKSLSKTKIRRTLRELGKEKICPGFTPYRNKDKKTLWKLGKEEICKGLIPSSVDLSAWK